MKTLENMFGKAKEKAKFTGKFALNYPEYFQEKAKVTTNTVNDLLSAFTPALSAAESVIYRNIVLNLTEEPALANLAMLGTMGLRMMQYGLPYIRQRKSVEPYFDLESKD